MSPGSLVMQALRDIRNLKPWTHVKIYHDSHAICVSTHTHRKNELYFTMRLVRQKYARFEISLVSTCDFADESWWYLRGMLVHDQDKLKIHLKITDFNARFASQQYCWDADSNEVLSMRRHPRGPQEQAATTCTVLHITFCKYQIYLWHVRTFFSLSGLQRVCNVFSRCWIIAGSSPFRCSIRPLSKEMHEVTVIACQQWC